jgi:DNA gyrase subunit A
VRSAGIIAINIEKEDELVAAAITDGNQIVFLASHEGQAIRFNEDDVRPMGRAAYGVWGMDLDKGDYIVGMAVTPKPGKAAMPQSASAAAVEVDGHDKKPKKTDGKGTVEEETINAAAASNMILSVTENGFGKRTGVDEYRLQSRGGKGVINIKTRERNGKVVGILLVNEESEAMLISHYGKIIRINTATIREAGRSAMGVRLLQLETGDKVAASCVIPPEEKEETLLQ